MNKGWHCILFMSTDIVILLAYFYIVVAMMVEFEDGSGWMLWKQSRTGCQKVIDSQYVLWIRSWAFISLKCQLTLVISVVSWMQARTSGNWSRMVLSSGSQPRSTPDHVLVAWRKLRGRDVILDMVYFLFSFKSSLKEKQPNFRLFFH